MQILIIPGDELPIYRQIMRQIADAVASGRLRLGDKLPSQRELAEELVISPLTVKKAYDELERRGLIATRRGRGTFISTTAPELDPAEVRRRLADTARRLLTEAHLSGVGLAELEGLIEEVHDELRAERARRRSSSRASAEQEPGKDRP